MATATYSASLITRKKTSSTLCAVERMRTNGIITDGEYEQCRKMLLEKYDPPVGKIVSN